MFNTIELNHQISPSVLNIILNRPEKRNSLNGTILDELLHALDLAEHDPQNRIIIIFGKAGFFCTGMDFNAVANQQDDFDSAIYMQLLSKLTTLPRIIISCVEGTAMGGGIGIVAASDLVIATSNSQFSLPEAIWGLLPACVAPYLIRRIGFQAAYRLTLTTQTIEADEAHRLQLVDILASNLQEAIRHQLMKLSRLDPRTIGTLKQYYRKLWLINSETEQLAVNQINDLMNTTWVRDNINNYVTHGEFPWDI